MSDLIDRQALKNKLKRWDGNDPYEFVEIAFWAVDNAPTIDAAAPRWVRCEERLPEDGFIGKLVCDDEGQISICHGFATVTLANGKVVYTDSRIFDVFKEETDLWDDVTHFTHWMPIEPPKEDA